jgi:hypothetical protein
MPHLGSWRKRCFISYEKGQKAEKGRKNGQKSAFFGIPIYIEIGTLSPIISLKSADLLVLAGISGFGDF